MGKGLTKRQREILTYVMSNMQQRGYPPSVREIGTALGLTSSSTVHSHLTALEKKGFIHRDPSKPRAIEILKDGASQPPKRVVNVPVLGRIAAGQPLLAEENVEDVFPLPRDLIREDAAFILRVRGDSMIEAGILDGDYLVIRQQATANNGEIVAALMGEEATVKRFYRERDHIRLQPENRTMQPILTRDATILGRVVALIRRLP
ncbi:MAG: transcriptional repressor LexA [Bacillati bacterium ANGP1]|uniref:LexA repressor n=1 Tax=Candidatus Segetimicrobium genomatis TaxID=2569760 RepID=A0A537J676_9BACT|nr:MAG: transcriptional repressor LexA [Terrabacteria group bacterium ANGP1]